MTNNFTPGARKRLGVPLSGHNSVEDITPDSTVQVVQPGNVPLLVQENGNLSIMLSQQWAGKDVAIELFSENKYRRGFVINNNGAFTIYIGTTDDPVLLKKIGTPIYTKASFSSALYQGRLCVVADDSAGANTVDVRIWEEQL